MVAEESCDECGHTRNVCPACGDPKVTQIDWISVNGEKHIALSTSLTEVLLESEDGDVVKFNTVCWECGWERIRTLEVGVEEN